MSERPRILLIGGHGGLSGVARHLRHIVRALQDDADLTVMHDHNSGGYDFLSDAQAKGLEQSGLATSLKPAKLWHAWRALQRARRAGDYDLIWAHARLSVLLLRLGSRRSRTPLMLTYHGLPFDPGQRRWARVIGLILEAVLLRLAPPMTLIVLSDTAEKQLRTTLPNATKRHRIKVLPNSSDLTPLPAALRTERPQIVMTGRVSWQKNLPAAAQILDHLPNAHLHMCGEGTDSSDFAETLRRTIPAETLSRLTRHGPVADVGPMLARADLYLLTSQYEGVPIGALEAFQAGVPLAMPSGSHDLLTHHPLAAQIAPGSPEQAAKDIDALLSTYRVDPEGYSAKIRAAYTQHYGFAQWQTQARTLVEQVLA